MRMCHLDVETDFVIIRRLARNCPISKRQLSCRSIVPQQSAERALIL